jgi:hypothetical protein
LSTLPSKKWVTVAMSLQSAEHVGGFPSVNLGINPSALATHPLGLQTPPDTAYVNVVSESQLVRWHPVGGFFTV